MSITFRPLRWFVVCGLLVHGWQFPVAIAQEEAAAPSIGLEQAQAQFDAALAVLVQEEERQAVENPQPETPQMAAPPSSAQTKPSVASARNRQAAVEAAAATGAAPSESKPHARSEQPPSPPDPAELVNAQLDADGKLQFQFRNQPWPEVLRWLAKVSDQSLDWQELPGDYINLSTRRPYTLAETKDAINRALLLRGYTLLDYEDSLTVTKTEEINPAIVPRVRAERLAELQPHAFVRTSFELNWLLAEDVYEEFASMMSANGKLTPLLSTNRLDALDIAGNLRELYDILTEEQSAVALENLAQEFQLVYARASQVKGDLERFLGVQSEGAAARGNLMGGDPRAMQQMQQQMQQQIQQQMQQQLQQMQQQQAQRQPQAGGGRPGAGAAGGSRSRQENVYIIANDRSNSLIVHAPPHKRALIESFIKRIDVPNEMASDLERINIRTRVFRLISLSPQELVASLNAMDVLDPMTKLQVNEDNRSVIAYASLADQLLIQQVIDRLDGSQRSMHVVQLRRLDAESVAGSVRFLLGGEEEEAGQNRNRGYYDPWSGYSSRGGSTTAAKEKMRVTANVRDNQLLLWVNQIELDEVNKLLVKLGEVPPAGGRTSTQRVVDASRSADTYEYLKRLKEHWDKISDVPLNIPAEADFRSRATNEPGADDAEAQPSEPPPTVERDAITGRLTAPGRPMRLIGTQVTNPFAAEDQSEPSAQPPGQPPSTTARRLPPALAELASADSEADASEQMARGARQSAGPAAKPAVSIRLDDRGNLVLESEDTVALDQLEMLMLDNRPPRREYEVFKVRHAPATWIRLNLRDYFEKKKDEPQPRGGFYSYWDFEIGRSNANSQRDERQLGKRAPLEFIADNDTSTIVVKNADDRDLRTIAELIQLWDVPAKPEPSNRLRYSQTIALKYTRASKVLDTVKEAYRDLLSSNDKAFEKPASEGENRRDSGSDFTYKGRLSLAADEVGNQIIVTAQGEDLLKVVLKTISDIDEAAKEQDFIQVVTIGDKLEAKAMEEALKAILMPPAKPEAPQAANKAQAEAAAAQQAQALQNGSNSNRSRGNRGASR